MLTRALVRMSVVVAVGLSGLLVAVPAYADYVYCPPGGGFCTVVVETPGSPGAGGGPGNSGGGTQSCRWAGQVVDCTYTMSDGASGWLNGTDGCYYFEMSPQPAAGSPLWNGHSPSDGTVYETLCYPANAIAPLGIGGVGFVWLASPPPGFGGGVSAVTLAARALNQLPIRGPQIRTAPTTAGVGLVGLNVWLWTAVDPSTWGPVSATASVPGLSVTATARASRIVWTMGDGRSVTCANPGTPYAASYGGARSPSCGYVYTTSSRAQPGGVFTVTATTTWRVTWVGGGTSGVLTVNRSSTSTLRINELEAVTQ